jgi:hypothetical protein
MRLFSRSTCLLVLLALIVVGCAGSRLPSVEPGSLKQVNRVLDGRWARIQKTDGTLIEHLEEVRVGVDSTTFYHRLDQRQRTIPTDSVLRVAVRGDSGAGQGFLRGAAPGIVVSFMGLGFLGTSVAGDGSSWEVAFGGVVVAGGVLIGLIGGLAGALTANKPEWDPVYKAPLDQYLN